MSTCVKNMTIQPVYVFSWGCGLRICGVGSNYSTISQQESLQVKSWKKFRKKKLRQNTQQEGKFSNDGICVEPPEDKKQNKEKWGVSNWH